MVWPLSASYLQKLLSGSMKGKEDANSYKSILKGTSILGGVQLFQIVVNLIRVKFVTLFLGPAGMGVSSLFNTSSQTIQQFAGLGLNLAIVKEVAARKNNSESLKHAISVAKTIVLITALIGAIVCLIFAVPLSRVTFGNDEYEWQFTLLSLVIFFGVLGQGYLSILQGMHEVKLISRSTVVGSLTGLLVGVPLYAFFGVKGIVPAMLILVLSMFITYVLSIRKVLPGFKRNFIWQEHKPLVKKLLVLGLILMASEGIGTACNYLLNLFIRVFGELENVGLYQAANSVTNQYSGMVFTAMMLDYFPRLSEAASDNMKIKEIVNRQLEIVSLIATPLICLLILSSPLVIDILLTSQFKPILELMRWLGFGVLIKAIMFPLGYIAFAKDNKKLFFWMEGIFLNFLTLFLSCFFYWKFGLIGLGYSLVIDCIVCLIVYYLINHYLYQYSVNKEAIKQIGIGLALGMACFLFSLLEDHILSYSLMGGITLMTVVYSFIVLKKKLRT